MQNYCKAKQPVFYYKRGGCVTAILMPRSGKVRFDRVFQ